MHIPLSSIHQNSCKWLTIQSTSQVLPFHLAWRGPNRRPWQPQIALRGRAWSLFFSSASSRSRKRRMHIKNSYTPRGQGLGDAVGNKQIRTVVLFQRPKSSRFPTKKVGKPTNTWKKTWKNFSLRTENTAFLLPTYPNGCLEINVAAVV